jgi:Glycosyl transferase WecG/TagA/CpsF family
MPVSCHPGMHRAIVFGARFSGNINFDGSSPGIAEARSRVRNGPGSTSTRPHFLWVGLSTPKQELWLQMHMPKIAMGIGIGVGAAFDLVAGTTPQAPRWIQRSGLEWLFRLAMEPKRLFRRYLIVIPRFFGFFIGALIRR